MKITAKKTKLRKLQTNSVPADQLTTIYAVRTLGEERKLGQYKLIENGIAQYFNNFDELKYYSNLVLRDKHKHVVIVRGQAPDDPC